MDVTLMRRTFDRLGNSMQSSRAFARPALVLIALVLATAAGRLGAFPLEIEHAVAQHASSFARGVGRVASSATNSDDATRAAFVRAPGPVVARLHASRSSGSDGARGLDADSSAAWPAWFAEIRAPGGIVAARNDGIAAPGQPAPSSRAPPIA